MDEEYLIDCIENEIESSNFDFKKDIYDFSIQQNKEDFLTDVLSFANGHAFVDKFIITGVKLYNDGSRDLNGITEYKIKDGADYQSLINDNIEPNVTVDFFVKDYNSKKYGIFKIGKENTDKPYLLSKKYGNLSKGFIKIRKGQKNEFISRRDLDKYYKDKLSSETSEIKVRGIENKKILDNIFLYKYTCNYDFEKLKNEIYNLFVKIYNFNLDKSNNGGIALGSLIELKNSDIKNIKKYERENDMIITDNFFDIGNLKYFQIATGMGGSYTGSESEKEKYKLICYLEELTGIYNGTKNFYDKLTTIFYSEILIENVGKKYDEDIDITLKIKEEDFFDFCDLPVPSEDIIEKMLEKDILNGILENKKASDIKTATGWTNFVTPIKPSSYTIPGTIGHFGPGYESYVAYYKECINYIADYEIIREDEYVFVKFEQKKINPNEKIFFPSRMLFKKIPKLIEYEIKSKYNSEIQKGTLFCNG